MQARTVTMLFTDIEGSTRLVQELDEAWGDVVSQHRRTCRTAWAHEGGREVDTAGDGFFVVFDDDAPAVRATLHAQVMLSEVAWPRGSVVRVRMGLHAGPATEHDGSWIGYEVHRAARIAGAAHGGQVVASATVDLTGLPAGVLRLDLGHHHLKDLARPEQLFGIVGPGMRSEFPPVRTTGTPGASEQVTFPPTSRNPVDVVPGALTRPDGAFVVVSGYGLRLGRTPDNDLCLPDTEVSRHHCAISATDGGFVLTDLQSTNGTRVNGVRLRTSRLLADGDRLGIGGAELVFTWPAGHLP